MRFIKHISTRQNNTLPKLTLSFSGTFKLNTAACKLLGDGIGTHVQVAVSDEQPSTIYLFLDTEAGPTIRTTKEGGAMFSSASMRDEIAKLTNKPPVKGAPAKFLLHPEPETHMVDGQEYHLWVCRRQFS